MNKDRVDATAAQMGLFERKARRSDPDTSKAAASRASGRTDTHGAKIRLCLMDVLDGGTCYEIAAVTGLTHVQVDRQMRALQRRGYVAETTTRRNSPNGDPCIVWSIAPVKH